MAMVLEYVLLRLSMSFSISLSATGSILRFLLEFARMKLPEPCRDIGRLRSLNSMPTNSVFIELRSDSRFFTLYAATSFSMDLTHISHSSMLLAATSRVRYDGPYTIENDDFSNVFWWNFLKTSV